MVELEISQLERKYEELRIRDRQRLSQLVSRLAERGQEHPVMVVPGAEEGRYVLIDGYLRIAALKRLGRDLCAAVVVELSEVEALLWSQKLDSRRRLSVLEEGWFLREVVEGHGIKSRELARRLQRSTSWVSRRLSLVKELPTSVQKAVRDGRVRPQVAMKVLVPLARANTAACERLMETVGAEPWSVREMENLYQSWRAGDAEQRERIVERPELYRKVESTLGSSAKRPRDPVVADLELLAAIATRVYGHIDARSGALRDARTHRRVARLWPRARAAFEALAATLEEEVAESRNADSHSAPERSGTREPHHRAHAGDLA